MSPTRTFPTNRSLAEAIGSKTRKRRQSLAASAEAQRGPVRIRNDLLPALRLVDRRLDDLRPPARNVRPPEPGHIREVARSIETLGFTRPVLIDGSGQIIDGWVSVKAARMVGLAQVPCLVVDHLSPSERRLLRIALNRLGEKGRWDVDELKIEFEELVLEDTPLEISGFSTLEIDGIRLGEEPDAIEEGPLEPEPGAEPITRPGDIIRLGPHRVACGDARDHNLKARLMGGEPAQLILTDVPYNVPIRGHVTKGQHREFATASGEMTPEAFQAFNAAWMEAAHRHLVDGGILATYIDWRGLGSVTAAALGLGLEQLNLVVWTKSNAGMGSLYRSAHELLPVFKKGKEPHRNNIQLGRHGRWRSNVWTYPGASSAGSDARKGLKDHPTVKPVAMLEDALIDLTDRGDVVLDPFLGSGSTLIAAEKTGRVCRGVEIDPLYVDVILRRYEALTGRKPVKVVDP